MLLRWLILRLCASRPEIRLVLRTMRQYREHLNALGLSEPFRIGDRRIVRRRRLSMLVGVLMVHVQNPALVAMSLWAVPVAIAAAIWHTVMWLVG